MTKPNIFIRGTVPPDLHQEFLQYVRDFDATHADCHFELLADVPEMPLIDMLKTMQVEPGMTFASFFERKKPT